MRSRYTSPRALLMSSRPKRRPSSDAGLASRGRFTGEEEVDYVAELVIEKVRKLREMSPLYEMFKDGVDLKSVAWAAH